MGEMKKSNKKILDLPFGDNEFEIVDADEYIDTILYGNNEERENKTFKKLSREQKMVLTERFTASNRLHCSRRC